MGQRLDRFKATVKSQRGKNTITFFVFLVISSVLWIVQTLNDETQRDVRMTVRITNVPDSVTRISPVPHFINVNLRSRGTTVLRYLFNSNPEMNIDYRTYANGNRISFNESALKAYFRTKIGGGCQIMSVSPDSLNIYFTNQHGVSVPVKVDANVEPGPQYALIGKVRSLTDTVKVYSLDRSAAWMRSISTVPIVLNGVSSSQTLRVPLLTPKNVRAIPDSVDVHIDVEPLVSKSREIEIKPINTPDNVELILSPRQVEVYYMVPMSIYKMSGSDPKFTITADYRTLNPATGKIAVSLASAPRDFYDVFLDTDSVGFILENRNQDQ